MDNLVIKNVDVMGDTIMAAKDSNGDVWVGIRWICDGLGMTEGHMKRQIKNIKKDLALSQGGSNLTLNKGSGEREVFCIKLDYLPIWLAKISITPTIQRDHPELAKKLLEYQLKAKDILAEAFLTNNGMPKSTDGKIALLAQGHTELVQKVDEMDKKVDELSDRLEKSLLELPVLGLELNDINRALKRRGVDCLGGKDSAAYHDKSLRQKLYWDIHIQLRREFQVSTYRAIRRNQTEDAIRFLESYQPPIAMREEINRINSQTI